MKNFTPLPTTNEEWGFWGTSNQSGYKTAEIWETTSRFFAEHFDLNAEQARDLLDARFGRHLVDDFSFIVGVINTRSVTNHLTRKLDDKSWRKYIEKSIKDETSKTYAPKTISKQEFFTKIAQEHLNIETLEERHSDSLDFHDVGVVGVYRALEAAFEAGRRAAKLKK